MARDEKGRLLPGTSGNPAGRKPVAKTAAQLREDIERKIADHIAGLKLTKIIDKMVALAERGDKQAAKIVLEYSRSAQVDRQGAAPKEQPSVLIVIRNTTKDQKPPIEGEILHGNDEGRRVQILDRSGEAAHS